MWGHSKLASQIISFTALYRAQYNTWTSLQSGHFQGPKANLLGAQLNAPDQSQATLFWPIIEQAILTNHR